MRSEPSYPTLRTRDFGLPCRLPLPRHLLGFGNLGGSRFVLLQRLPPQPPTAQTIGGFSARYPLRRHLLSLGHVPLNPRYTQPIIDRKR